MATREINWKLVLKLPLMVVVAIGAPSFAIWGLHAIGPDTLLKPELTLTVLLIAGVVALIAVLGSTVVLFGFLGLSDKARAFGMPEGTIRAVIALGLILIFAITSVFLYEELRKPEESIIYDQTYEQLIDISAKNNVKISQKHCMAEGGKCKQPSDYHYDVAVLSTASKSSEDFAKQLLTVISTLVVAVAGFYFGSRSIAAARGAVAPSEPLIRSINPKEGKQGVPQMDVEITGKNLELVKSVKLTREAKEIMLTNILSSASTIQGKIAIPDNQDEGMYDLIVVDKDDSEDRMTSAFKVIKK